jgi:outer membrane protein OmpA-like peptidoglycan-associated protein
MNWKLLILGMMGVALFAVEGAAQTAAEWKRMGDLYYNNGKYADAADAFTQFLKHKQHDESASLKLAACQLELGETQRARTVLAQLSELKKPDPEVYFYSGRLYHLENNFTKAVDFYKSFLAVAKDDHPYRQAAKHFVRQCGQGIIISGTPRLAITENLGDNVNGPLNDFAPVVVGENTLYFSSVRDYNIGRLRDEEGYENELIGQYTSDIYLSRLINGAWTATSAISGNINTSKNEVVLDVAQKGNIIYYYSGNNGGKMSILSDTIFKRESVPQVFASPIAKDENKAHFCVFNDSTLIFSANLKGGIGGNDLYVSLRNSLGYWTRPKNLGYEVNSPYDETTPFMAKDGKTLFFSSNGKNSMGGYDVFKVVYDDKSKKWLAPTNLGLPINSSSDDLYFRLDPSGLKAYFSSNRLGGMGESDIYVAYFKEAQPEQTPPNPSELAFYIGNQPTFDPNAPDADKPLASGPSSSGNPGTVAAPVEAQEYLIAPIFYEDENVLTPQNVQKLSKVAALLQEHPQLSVEVISHSDDSDIEKYRLYFSYKRAEKVADHLLKIGVDASDIHLKGCGSAYPVALNVMPNGSPNPIGHNLNKRIEIILHNTQGLPIKIVNTTPQVNKIMVSDKDSYRKEAIKGLSYKVQVAAMKQMYDSDIITAYPDATVESSPDSDVLYYTVGLYRTYASAEQLRQDLIAKGVNGAFVVPYLDGIRTTKEESKILASSYPDLLNFINGTSQN